MLQAVQVLNNPAGGTIEVCTVYGSKYGANLRSGYSLSYKPPKLPTPVSVVSNVASGVNTVLTDVIDALTGAPVGDVASAIGGSKSLLPLALAAVAAWLVLR